MAQFKHNRKRNSGLVYEFLVRQLGTALVEKDRGEYDRTLGIIRKYYGEGTVLDGERELFEVVRSTRGVTEQVARQVLAEVQKHARAMDAKKIDIKKSNLIKEVNYSFGQDFFSRHRVPEYRLLASIQMVIDACRGPAQLSESVAKIQLEEGLVKYMTSKKSELMTVGDKSQVDALVMRMVAKRFEEKYSRTLAPSQKRLLERYVRYQVTGDRKQLTDFIGAEVKRGAACIDGAAALREVRDDRVMAEKLAESRKRLSELGSKAGDEKSTDVVVEEMMLFQKLFEEIESEGD